MVAALLCLGIACAAAWPALDAVLQARQPVVDGRVIGYVPGGGPRGVAVLIRDVDGPAGHRIVNMQHQIDDTTRGTMLRVQRSTLDPDFVGEPAVVRDRRDDRLPIVVGLFVLFAAVAFRAGGFGVAVTGGRHVGGR